MTSGSSSFGVVVDLPIDVVKNFGLVGEVGFVSELGSGGRFVSGFFVDRFEVVFGDDLFFDQRLLPEVDRVVLGHVFLDLFLGPILFGVRIGDGVTFVSIGHDLEQGRLGFFVGAFD